MIRRVMLTLEVQLNSRFNAASLFRFEIRSSQIMGIQPARRKTEGQAVPFCRDTQREGVTVSTAPIQAYGDAQE